MSDCFDDTHWLVYKSSGGLEDNSPGGHRKVSAVVQSGGIVWLSAGAAPSSVPPPVVLAQQARNELVLPAPGLS